MIVPPGDAHARTRVFERAGYVARPQARTRVFERAGYVAGLPTPQLGLAADGRPGLNDRAIASPAYNTAMTDLETQILAIVARKSYHPLKPKALARKLGLPASQYGHFRHAVRGLLK